MKKKIFILMLVFLLIGANLYAAGDLIVEGDAGVGTTTLTGKLNVIDATKVPLIIDNSTGTQNILEVKDNGTNIFTIKDGGYIGIGTSPGLTRTINAYQIFNTASAASGITFTMGNTGTGGGYGVNANAATNHLSGNVPILVGGYYQASQSSSQSLTTMIGIRALTGGSGTGNVTTNRAIDVWGRLTSGASTNAEGIYIRNIIGSGSVSNVYGIYLEQQTKGTDNYQIYSVDGKSYFGGAVGIGVTNPTQKLDVAGTVNASGGYTQVSDVKFKRDITAIESPLNKILNIKGVTYSYKTDEYKDRGFSEGMHYGVIGQEVEKVLPEVVKESPNGEKSVSYTELIPVLIEAVKEQQKVIEELKAKVRQLEGRGLVAKSQ